METETMSSEDIATALVRKALNHKGVSGWPNTESLHNANLFDEVVYSVNAYNEICPGQLTDEFITWVEGHGGIINVMGSRREVHAAADLLFTVNRFVSEYEVD